MVLLNLLLGDVGRELSSGFLPRAAKDCRFLGFLHFVSLVPWNGMFLIVWLLLPTQSNSFLLLSLIS